MGLRDVSSVEKVVEELSTQNYLADRGLATAVFLSLRQNRPLLLEGEAGVGTVSYTHLTLPTILLV